MINDYHRREPGSADGRDNEVGRADQVTFSTCSTVRLIITVIQNLINKNYFVQIKSDESGV